VKGLSVLLAALLAQSPDGGERADVWSELLDAGVYPVVSALGCGVAYEPDGGETCGTEGGPLLGSGWWLTGSSLLRNGRAIVERDNRILELEVENEQLRTLVGPRPFIWGLCAGLVTAVGLGAYLHFSGALK
jgi:hypothetical protein